MLLISPNFDVKSIIFPQFWPWVFKGWDDISIRTWPIPYRYAWMPYRDTFRNFIGNKFGNF